MNKDVESVQQVWKFSSKNWALIEAERFVMLIQKDSFEHTKWREGLFNDMALDELSHRAKAYRKGR